MLDVEDLRFTYPGGGSREGGGDTLNGLSFEVEEGEIFGFLGPNGAGKSTTQNLLIGVLRGYRGSARAFGREIRDWGSELYERIGVAFEMPNHFARLTARENLEYFAKLHPGPTERVDDVLDQVGLGEQAEVQVGKFSKGMKHRLTYARSVLHRPKLLFLDEPTSGLDPANAHNLKGLIRQQRERGTTVFLTTHNMTDAEELCDRLALIVEGELRAVDTPAALRLRHGERRVRLEVGPALSSDSDSGSGFNSGSGTRGRGVEVHEFPLDGLGENAEFLRLLREHPIHTLHSQEPSLEQVFLELTGRSLS